MNKRIFGYARVSSKEQNLDRQLQALKVYVPEENIITDKASGKDFERENYKALKSAIGLREGDTLYITSLDRLSRNKKDIKDELAWFREKGIALKILDLPTSLIEVPEGQEWILDMITNVIIEVLASIAEQERKTIKERQRQGIVAAKDKGKHLGRPRVQKPDNFDEVVNDWKEGNITAKRAMNLLGLSRTSFYRLIKQND